MGRKLKLDKKPVDLTLEQQFSIHSFRSKVELMSREQAQNFCVELYQQMLIKDNMYNEMLRYEWGIAPNPEY
jgi:uncharacterized protein YaaW (UPF0174 family)